MQGNARVQSRKVTSTNRYVNSNVSGFGVRSTKGRWILFELDKDRDVSGGIPVSREYMVTQRPTESGFRDACNVWFENADGSLGLRFGVEAVSDEWESHEIWLDVAFKDGVVWSARSAGAPLSVFGKDDVASVRGAAGIRFECLDPFKTWLVSVDLEADRLTTEQLCADCVPDTTVQDRLRCELVLEMVAPPWIPGTLDAKAKARLAGEDGNFMSPRYEQLCLGQGSLQVHDRIVALQGNGLRIRRSGGRAFQGFQGHCWQSAIFPDGTAFGCNSYPPKAGETDAFSEAYIFRVGDSALTAARVVQTPWMRQLVTHGDDVSLILETDKERFEVVGGTFVNTRSRRHKILPPGFPIVEQAHAHYEWSGMTTVGMVERSSFPELIANLR